MNKIFAIADIHGCNKTLRALIDKISPSQEDQLIFLGDYIDRGPDSKDVLNYLISIKNQFRNTVLLRGNHEQMFLESDISIMAHERWISNGGEQVMMSYGLKNYDHVPHHIQEFISNTEYYYQNQHHICVHAGLNNLVSDPFNDYQSMMWIRNFIITKKMTGGRVVVHGHTPTSLTEIKKQIDASSIDLKICLDN
ncbi:MAG: serine/threonine protein phosphatase, partial [Cytophagales bacterium]|nr:serine/threonine protein phosphatase [Cytophaga sp.]